MERGHLHRLAAASVRQKADEALELVPVVPDGGWGTFLDAAVEEEVFQENGKSEGTRGTIYWGTSLGAFGNPPNIHPSIGDAQPKNEGPRKVPGALI